MSRREEKFENKALLAMLCLSVGLVNAQILLPHTEAQLVAVQNKIRSVDARIVGGSQVPSPNPYPWVVYFTFACGTEAYLCGGTAIQENVVMTAAHCWDYKCATSLTGSVSIGRDRRNPDETISSGLLRIAHPGYSSDKLQNDIALILLTKSSFDLKKFPKLATSTVSSGTAVVAAGWGATKPEGSGVAILRQVKLEVRSDSRCANYYGDAFVPATQLCAGANGKDTCQGDSGGPLFELTDCCDYPGVIVHGVTSYGDTCATFDGVYTQVSAFRDWIDEVLSDQMFENDIDDLTCCECNGGSGDIGSITECTTDDPDTSGARAIASSLLGLSLLVLGLIF